MHAAIVCTCAVRFFNNNQFEDHPPALLLTAAQFDEPDMRPVKPLPIQPFVPAAEPFPPTLLVPKPGGGPRADLLIGAPHNSDVVGVACCGTPSDQLLPFELSFEIALQNQKCNTVNNLSLLKQWKRKVNKNFTS